MKKILFFTFFAAVLSFSVFSLEVDKSELNAVQNETIEFINYTGPHKVIDSIEAIKGIGSSIGKTIVPEKASNSGNKNKYYVVHAVDDSTGKLDADILFIGSDATVDHITNLRRIISAYLSSAYGYSEKDADTLAVFITVYNAVYRGNFDSYKNKYKEIVTSNLSAANCGLSVNYKDWPGKSEIVIPLFNVKEGGLSTVDTSVISDSKVVDSMKEDDDKNIESRKDMVDIKEREAESASEKAKEAQKTAVEEQKKADEEKKKTEAAKKEAEDAKKEAEDAKKEAEEKKKVAEENPSDKKAAEEAKEAEKVAEEKQEEAEEKQEAAEAQEEAQKEAEEAAKEAREEASEQQTIADKKQNEAQNERKEIAKDQKEVQEKEAAEAAMPTEYGIVLTDEAQLLCRLVKFNSKTGEIIKNSPVSVIRNRTIYKTSEDFIAIAGENAKNSTVKLVLINTDTMEITAESNETIAEDSMLIKDGSDYYCVIQNDKYWTLGKFDEKLSLKLKSEINVKSSTPITVTDSGIVVTDNSGKLKLLSKSDLNEVKSN